MNKKGFTLVELLAVIVILAIILVIAIPKINNNIRSSKESAFLSSAKSIVRELEYSNIESSSLNRTSLSTFNLNISSSDFDLTNSYAYMTNGIIYIDLVGIGQFNGMYACGVTSNNGTVVDTAC